MSTDFKLIPLKDIKPDPNQPRKYYDESAMQELTDSVREKGILQPILIRPNGKGYILVCGERRLKAAISVQTLHKERDSIPAVIRDLTDEEALELQIIENLQRKDVHPMEEAVAIKSLLENMNRKLTMEEVAAKLGKTIYYVRQRNRLNSLSKAWQDIFYRGKLHVSVALEISSFGQNEQEVLYKNKVNKSNLKNPQWEPSISDWDLNQLKRKLKSAPFDINDKDLVTNAGACGTCPFNSAFASLFPEDAKDPVCNKASCYSLKCSRAFDIKLKAFLDKADGILICGYTGREDSDLIKQLEKDGHKIHSTEYDGDVVTADDWKYTSMKGMPVKGLYVGGNEKGKTVMVKIKTAKSSNNTKEKKKAGTLTAADIDAEIARVKEREQRNKELDLQKIHIATVDALEDNKIFEKPTVKFQPIDRGIMIFLLLESCRMVNSDDIPGMPEEPKNEKEYNEKYFEKLSKLSDDNLALMVRKIAWEQYSSRNMQYGMKIEDSIIRIIASYAGIDLKKIEADQAEAAAKRKGNVEKRLSSLASQKANLKKATKQPATKKKSAKK